MKPLPRRIWLTIFLLLAFTGCDSESIRTTLFSKLFRLPELLGSAIRSAPRPDSGERPRVSASTDSAFGAAETGSIEAEFDIMEGALRVAEAAR